MSFYCSTDVGGRSCCRANGAVDITLGRARLCCLLGHVPHRGVFEARVSDLNENNVEVLAILTCICLIAGVNLLTPSGHRQIRDANTTGIDMCGRRMRKGGGGDGPYIRRGAD